MALIKEKRSFEGGMSSDEDETSQAPNTYRKAVNFRISKSGNRGVVTSVKGNELVSYTLPTGGNKIIGSAEYETESKLYYLVWNSNSDHLVLEYDYGTNVISTVFASALLGFSHDVLITGINIVKFKDNTLIVWADPSGEVKKISIESGIRTYDNDQSVYEGDWSAGAYLLGNVVRVAFGSGFHNRDYYYIAQSDTSQQPYTDTSNPIPNSDWKFIKSGFVYPSTIEGRDIYLMPTPPLNSPFVTYEDNDELATNRLKSAMWQFKYKYKYFDGQKSAWSPISKAPVPSSLKNPLDTTFSEIWKDNQIKVSVSIDNNPLISSIEIASREMNDSKAAGDFFVHNEVFLDDVHLVWDEEGSNTIINDIFTNTEEKIGVDITESNQLFYYVPKEAKDVEITGDNRAIISGGKIGNDLDVNLITVDIPEIESIYADPIVLADVDILLPPLTTLPYPTSTILPIPTPSQTYDFFDIGDALITDIKAGDTFSFSLSGNSIVAETVSANPYPNGFPDGGVKKFAFSDKYVVQEADVKSHSVSGLKDFIATEISKLIKAQYIKSFGYRNISNGTSQWNVSRYHLQGAASGSKVRIYEELLLENAITSNDYWVRTTITSATASYNDGGTITNRTHKRGSLERFGFEYTDGLGRVSTIIANDNTQIGVDWITNSSAITGNGMANLNMNINHLAPSWAKKCYISKKTDNGITNFIQLPTSIQNTETGINSGVSGKYYVNGLVDSTGLAIDPSITGTETVCIYLNALNGDSSTAYNNAVSNSVLSYSFTKGDRVRFIRNDAGDKWFSDDVEILGYNDTWNYIIINKDHLNPSSITPNLKALFTTNNQDDVTGGVSELRGLLFEIYTPKNDSDLTGFYYETGIELDVIDGEHVGTDGVTQNYGASPKVPAIVALDSGDVYYKTRRYNITAGVSIEYMVEDYNLNDAFNSKVSNVGRFNLKTQIDSEEGSDDRSGITQESDKLSTMFFSESYIQGTNVNRLGTVYDLNFKEADASFNSIQRVHSDGDKLFIFQEDRVGIAHNSRYVSTDLESNQTVSSGLTAPPISDIRYYEYRGGISLNPESFDFIGNRKYFFDLRRGNICRLSLNGIESISLKGLDKYTKDRSDKMLSGAEKDIAIGVIDKRSGEYVLNLKWSEEINVSPLIVDFSGGTYNYDIDVGNDIYTSQFFEGGAISMYDTTTGNYYPKNVIQSVTGTVVRVGFLAQLDIDYSYIVNAYKSDIVSYSDTLGVWNSFYSYVPDFLDNAGMNLITWKDGQLYLHDSNSANQGEFYGEDLDSQLTIVSNQHPETIKLFKNVKLLTNDTYGDSDWSTTPDGVNTSTEQVSELISDDFAYKENSMTAGFLRDSNTPNEDYPLLDGERLRGRWLTIECNLDGGLTNQKEILGAEFNNAVSFKS
jgi:hypothetical protein